MNLILRMPAAEFALYLVGAVAVPVALVFNNFH